MFLAFYFGFILYFSLIFHLLGVKFDDGDNYSGPDIYDLNYNDKSETYNIRLHHVRGGGKSEEVTRPRSSKAEEAAKSLEATITRRRCQVPGGVRRRCEFTPRAAEFRR